MDWCLYVVAVFIWTQNLSTGVFTWHVINYSKSGCRREWRVLIRCLGRVTATRLECFEVASVWAGHQKVYEQCILLCLAILLTGTLFISCLKEVNTIRTFSSAKSGSWLFGLAFLKHVYHWCKTITQNDFARVLYFSKSWQRVDSTLVATVHPTVSFFSLWHPFFAAYIMSYLPRLSLHTFTTPAADFM